jgi:hypothetical protein
MESRKLYFSCDDEAFAAECAMLEADGVHPLQDITGKLNAWLIAYIFAKVFLG